MSDTSTPKREPTPTQPPKPSEGDGRPGLPLEAYHPIGSGESATPIASGASAEATRQSIAGGKGMPTWAWFLIGGVGVVIVLAVLFAG